MNETRIIGTFGTKMYIVYDEQGVEVPNTFIRSLGHNQAEKTARAWYGKNAIVVYTEV